MTIATLGLRGAFATGALAAALFGLGLVSDVTEEDVRAFEGVTPARIAVDAAPGALYAVTRTRISTPLCALHDGPKTRTRREGVYVNLLGESAPPLTLLGRTIGPPAQAAPAERAAAYEVETFGAGYRPDLEPVCEDAALEASARGDVVCVIDAVFRRSGETAPFAVRFKPFAFAPAEAGAFPRCPLSGPGAGLARLKRPLIDYREIVAGEG